MATPFDQVYKMVSLQKNRQLSVFDPFIDWENWWKYHSDVIIENWYYYYGKQHAFMPQFEGEDMKSFLARIKNTTIENHVKFIIDSMVSNLYKPDSVKRYVTRGDESDKKLHEWFEYNVWTEENTGVFDDSKALNALVTGYTILQRYLIDTRNGRPFPVTASNTERVKYGVIRKKLLDSGNCVPLPRIGSSGFVYKDDIGAILIKGSYDNSIGDPLVEELMNNTSEKADFIEYVDDVMWLRWIRREGESKWTQETVNPGSIYENRNQFKSVKIPFTVYRNTGDPFSVEGESEVEQLKSMNLELNELGSGDRQTISYHQNPILMGLAGAELPNDFVRGVNTHVAFERKDAKLEYLVWDGKLQESRERQEQLRRNMSTVSGISLISRGFLKDIGQIRSGPPLKAMFSSERSTMNRKFLRFSSCEREDMLADTRFWEIISNSNLNIDKTVRFHCDFNQDFLGIDRLLEEEIKVLRAQNTDTVEEILREEHPDWSEEEIKSSAKKIEESKKSKQQPKAISKSPDKQASNSSQ